MKSAFAFLVFLALPVAACAAEAAPPNCTVTHFDDAQVQQHPWGWMRWLMNSQADPKAEMTLGIVHIEPNQSNPVHIHPNSAEYLHVLAGSCEHRVGDKWLPMKTGDTIRIPKGVQHSARTGKEACRVLVVYDTGDRKMVPVAPAAK